MLPSDPTSHYYSHNAARLAEEYDRAGDGLLPIIEKNCPDKSARILDYGCGTGRDLARLSKKGYTNLMGYDPSTEMIVAGRAKYPQIENYLHHELTHIAAASFDLLICSAVLQHIEAGKLSAFLKNLTSYLQPGAGWLLLLSYPLQWPGCESEPRRVVLHSPAEVRLALQQLGLSELSFSTSQDSLSRAGREWGEIPIIFLSGVVLLGFV
ncbi:MAG: methyltransferase domain-containing protein [Leptospiraceae bacterium]|nr:methyltransferase domain-containing protein [Leptospiraceae bacterium]